MKNEIGNCSFQIGNCNISSNQFKVIDFGEKESKLIGTIGTDILENRKTILDFKNNAVFFNIKKTPKRIKNKLFDFTFKKRKIIIPTSLKNINENFLYDSGSSGYELLTTKEVWEKLKQPNTVIKVEKGNSWENVLTTYTTETNEILEFKNENIPLNEVTYVEGFSKTQYYLMKFSGMSGMLGNKVFFKKSIYIDCKDLKMGID